VESNKSTHLSLFLRQCLDDVPVDDDDHFNQD
jgi:hypothetical protein